MLSHLGSGSVVMQRRLQDALAGTEMPDDFAPGVWDEWNAKAPRAQADDAIVEDDRLLGAFDAVPGDERAGVAFSFGPVTVDFDEMVAARLNEHAFHTWDIEVAFDPAATIPPDATAVVVDNLGLIARFTARPSGDEREIRVRTSDPVRHFTVRLTPTPPSCWRATPASRPTWSCPPSPSAAWSTAGWTPTTAPR